MNYLFAIILMAFCQLAAATPYTVEISKSERLLLVKQDREIVKQYNIAHGKGGKGAKIRAGDNKTPTGAYRVMKLRNKSKFHFFIHLDYPNPLDAWRGYQNNVISAAEFKQIIQAYRRDRLPPQTTGLGGYIGIHGIGPITAEKSRIHKSLNWTEGCVALKNEEIIELRNYVSLGTRVVIRE